MDDEQNARTQAILDELRSLKYGLVFVGALIGLCIGTARQSADAAAVSIAVCIFVMMISLTALIWMKKK